MINNIPNSTIFDDLGFLSDPSIQLLQASARASCFSIRCLLLRLSLYRKRKAFAFYRVYSSLEQNFLFEISKAYQLTWTDKPQLAVQQMFCMRKTAKAELEVSVWSLLHSDSTRRPTNLVKLLQFLHNLVFQVCCLLRSSKLQKTVESALFYFSFQSVMTFRLQILSSWSLYFTDCCTMHVYFVISAA